MTRINELLEPKEAAGGFVTVKRISELYGIKAGAVYEFIRTDPSFPYVNGGVKKKFLINTTEFETWLVKRTEKQKNEHFGIRPAEELLRVSAQKVPTAKELLEKINK